MESIAGGSDILARLSGVSSNYFCDIGHAPNITHRAIATPTPMKAPIGPATSA
jgi:hypothetical protein